MRRVAGWSRAVVYPIRAWMHALSTVLFETAAHATGSIDGRILRLCSRSGQLHSRKTRPAIAPTVLRRRKVLHSRIIRTSCWGLGDGDTCWLQKEI
ncbi:hypothetical protein B0H13DRAFT_1982655 [Mycena leptocephala]|nr:hypothetical protein B0H13DRAFT_1982655 [Mycena leptocephala]